MKENGQEYQILFKDSPEYYYVKNARMMANDQSFVRFLVEKDGVTEDVFYPLVNIFRIKRVS